MAYYKVSLSAEQVLPLVEKKKYINSMYAEPSSYRKDEKRNQGFAMKFNNSIGFRSVVSLTDAVGVVTRPIVESPEDYISPQDAVFEHMQTPLFSTTIMDFYFEDKQVTHPKAQFSYDGKTLAKKWCVFLQKVFPHLVTIFECVENIPSLSLKDFALQYFYRNIDETVQYTIEFSAGAYLNEEELKETTSALNTIFSGKVTIAQHECNTCREYSDGEKPYHIEVVYLTNYNGVDESENIYKQYGSFIYQLKTEEEISDKKEQ